MIYRTLSTNHTGQHIVACPHIPPYASLNLFEMPDRSVIYESVLHGHVFFKPSWKVIVIWCPDCYTKLRDFERGEGVFTRSCSQ